MRPRIYLSKIFRRFSGLFWPIFAAAGFSWTLAHPLPETVLDLSDYHETVEEEKLQLTQITLDSHPFLFDMEEMKQDFVLMTKKLEFPEYPTAFNPSIIRWRGSLLLSFRLRDPISGWTNPFALVWLDENFDPKSKPQIFELPYHNPVLPSKQQDPRLVEVNGRLFVVYNNQHESIVHREMRRMFIVEMDFDGEKFIPGEPECFLDYEGKNELRSEKNWVPFQYNGKLLFAYSLNPHRILHPLAGTGACETVATSLAEIKWDWGVLRGGTQAFLDGDHYLAFFHSSKNIATVQSNGKKIIHYVMGAYTFEAHPPFSITSISPEPIVTKNFYSPPYYKTWKPLRCVFPAGMVFDEDYVWIAYGRQDHEVWVAKIDKKALLNSLIPVQKIQ